MSGFGVTGNGFSGIVGIDSIGGANDVTGGCSGGSHGFVISGGVVKTGVCGGKSPMTGGVVNIGTIGGSSTTGGAEKIGGKSSVGGGKTGGRSWTGGGRMGGNS